MNIISVFAAITAGAASILLYMGVRHTHWMLGLPLPIIGVTSYLMGVMWQTACFYLFASTISAICVTEGVSIRDNVDQKNQLAQRKAEREQQETKRQAEQKAEAERCARTMEQLKAERDQRARQYEDLLYLINNGTSPQRTTTSRPPIVTPTPVQQEQQSRQALERQYKLLPALPTTLTPRRLPLSLPAPLKAHRSRKREGLGQKLRFSIFKRDHYRCQICGAYASDDVQLEVDHKIPIAKGGTNDPRNLWTLCFDCNRGKSDSDL